MPHTPVSPATRSVLPTAVRLRRDIHRHPETGFREVRTAALIAKTLRRLGYDVRTKVARTGVIGVLKGRRSGRTLMIRADMDALPVLEATRLPFASANRGVMHACGHDAHVAIALAAAALLARERDRLMGQVKFVFQPAEEGPGGAKPMIEQGALERPRVDAAVGLHLWNDLPVGQMGIRSGALLAASDFFEVDILGRGGHGAAPHQTVDPVLMAARAVEALQSIRSRYVDPLKPAVISVCRIAGGTANNSIPDSVRIAGTVRSFDPALRKQLPKLIEQVLRGVVGTAGGRFDLKYHFMYPPTINHPDWAKRLTAVATPLIGEKNIRPDVQTLGGEDMSFFLQEVPGCFFFLGSADPKVGRGRPHHSGGFDPDERSIPLGIEMFRRITEGYLSPGGMNSSD